MGSIPPCINPLISRNWPEMSGYYRKNRFFRPAKANADLHIHPARWRFHGGLSPSGLRASRSWDNIAGGDRAQAGNRKMDRVAIILFLLMLAAVLGGCNGPQSAETGESSVRIGGETTYRVDVAATPEERQQGLSGRESMAQDTGMLFVFDEELPRHFWMKDMNFPLDIIWIDGNCALAGVSEDVPIPVDGAESDQIPRAQSVVPAQFVLEVNAGEWARNAMETGDGIEFLGAIEGMYGC